MTDTEKDPQTATDAGTEEFFDRYATALLARDAAAIGRLYAVPALILFPDQPIAVSSTEQTEAFFAASWHQYEGVEDIDRRAVIMGRAPGSVWADVTWSYGGTPRERFCYQLIDGPDGPLIAVLTPLS